MTRGFVEIYNFSVGLATLGETCTQLFGPDDFNGHGFFYEFGLQASIVEEYEAVRASSHLAEALKKTWDNSLNYSATSRKLNLAISGVIWLTFMTINPFQFRFYARSYWTASGLQASIVEDHAEEFNWPSPGG